MHKILFAFVFLIFSSTAFSEEWQHILDRESDGQPIEMDFHSIKAENNYIFLNIRYSPSSGWKSLISNIAYHQEGIVVSCEKQSYAVATEIDVLKNGSKKIKSSKPLPSLNYITPDNGSEPKKIIESLCEKLSPQMAITKQAPVAVESQPKPATATVGAKSAILDKSPTEYNWRYLAKGVDDKQTLFISTPLIARIDENNILVITRSEYPESKTLLSGSYFKYEVTGQVINCKDSTAVIPWIDFYAENNQLVETFYREISELETQKIPANSLIEFVSKTACPIGLSQAVVGKSSDKPAEESKLSESTGTAWLVSSSTLVTAYHVVHNAVSIQVVVDEKDVIEASVIATDPSNDIAILKLKKPLKSAPLYLSTKQPRLGSRVGVLGYPLSDVLGFKIQATTGEVSGLRGVKDDQRFYQISAPIQSGNSGGPVLNQEGEVVGIVSSKLNALAIMKASGEVPQNVNFAMKFPYIKALMESAGIAVKTAQRKTKSLEDAIHNAKNSVYLIYVLSQSSE